MTTTEEFLARTGEVDARLSVVLTIARSLSQPLREADLLAIIMDGVSKLLDAERSTLFLLSTDERVLWSTIAQGDDVSRIELPVGEGIAGWVAGTGRELNLRDVYQDPRFDPTWDRLHGYRTTSMLCVPLRRSDGKIIGVAQAINKRSGYFTVDDQQMMRTILAMASIAIVNSQLTSTLLANNIELRGVKAELEEYVREIEMLFTIERTAHALESIDEVIAFALGELQRALPCEVIQLSLLDPRGQDCYRLWRAGHDVERLLRRDRDGYLSLVLREEGAIHSLCGGLGDDEARLAAEEGYAFVPDSGLTVALLADDRVLGALGLYGRAAPATCFDAGDGKLIALVAASIARIVQRFRAREQQDQQGRMATLGSALSMVLHDFKTPMTIASGYVQMMAQHPDAAQRERLAAAALRQLDRVVQMSKEVVEFARGTRELFVQKVMLAEFAQEAEELVRQVFLDSDVRVKVEARERGSIRLDASKLLRVVQNLARNAREAMSAQHGGRARGHFLLAIDRAGDDVEFVFVDDGPGVPKDFQDRMFEAFATHGKKDGSGLGLAMVARFAESHGGSVRYEDTPGGGATFRVRLPRAGPPQQPEAAAAAPASAAPAAATAAAAPDAGPSQPA